eukprot:7175308-Prymnesium_polylepis.2
MHVREQDELSLKCWGRGRAESCDNTCKASESTCDTRALDHMSSGTSNRAGISASPPRNRGCGSTRIRVRSARTRMRR